MGDTAVADYNQQVRQLSNKVCLYTISESTSREIIMALVVNVSISLLELLLRLAVGGVCGETSTRNYCQFLLSFILFRRRRLQENPVLIN